MLTKFEKDTVSCKQLVYIMICDPYSNETPFFNNNPSRKPFTFLSPTELWKQLYLHLSVNTGKNIE